MIEKNILPAMAVNNGTNDFYKNEGYGIIVIKELSLSGGLYATIQNYCRETP